MASPPEVVTHKPHFHRFSPVKEPVRVATTTAGTLGSSFENGDTIDDVTLATGDRILIKNQAAGEENGVYVVAASGAPARAYDGDDGNEFPGSLVLVKSGTANGGKVFRCTNATAPTLGTTAIAYAEFAPSVSLALDDLSDVNAPAPADGELLSWDDYLGAWVPAAPPGASSTGRLYVVVHGGGEDIVTSPAPEVDIPMPCDGTFTSWVLLGDAVGDAETDLWLDTYGNHPPTVDDSIVNGHYPSLSSQIKNEDTDLSDWTTVAFSEGNVLRFHLNDAVGLGRLTLALKYTKT